MVQPPAPPQRDQPCQSNALERCHPLLESAGRSVDQQASRRARSYLGATLNPGRLRGSPGRTTFLNVTEQARLLNSPQGIFWQTRHINKNSRNKNISTKQPNISDANATQRNIALRISPATTKTSSNVETNAMRCPSRSIAMPSSCLR